MNILLTGFYGEGNLGDETILRAIILNLPPFVSPIITSGKTKPALSDDRFPRYIRRRGVFSWSPFLCNALKSKKAIFSGGILQDWSADGVLFFASRIFAAAALKCAPSLWGAGIGPLRSKAARSIAAKALKYTEKVWLRDEASATLYKDLINRTPEIGTDWSWHFNSPTKPQTIIDGLTAINLRPWKHNISELEALKTTQFAQNTKFLGMPARKEDIKAIKALFPTAEIIQPATFEDYMTQCAVAENGIAMRYHAALAMLRAGTNLKLVPYDTKVEELKKAIVNKQNYIATNEKRFEQMREAFKKEFVC